MSDEPIRRAVHLWIKEVAPLAAKMNLMPRHVDALVARIEQCVRDHSDTTGETSDDIETSSDARR